MFNKIRIRCSQRELVNYIMYANLTDLNGPSVDVLNFLFERERFDKALMELFLWLRLRDFANVDLKITVCYH
jgi:hypothetical protein